MLVFGCHGKLDVHVYKPGLETKYFIIFYI